MPLQETDVKHFEGKLTGWFWIRGSVTSWVAEQLPKGEKWRLEGFKLPSIGGSCLAWCPPLEGMPPCPPIGSSLHVPYWNHKQKVDAVLVSSTSCFLDSEIEKLSAEGFFENERDYVAEELCLEVEVARQAALADAGNKGSQQADAGSACDKGSSKKAKAGSSGSKDGGKGGKGGKTAKDGGKDKDDNTARERKPKTQAAPAKRSMPTKSIGTQTPAAPPDHHPYSTSADYDHEYDREFDSYGCYNGQYSDPDEGRPL